MRGKEDVHEEVGRFFAPGLLHRLQEIGDLVDDLAKSSVSWEKTGQIASTYREHLTVFDVELRGGEDREGRGYNCFIDESLEAR